MRGRVGLTVATLVALAVLLSLGTWQVRRLAWKEDLLARIAAAPAAPIVPIAVLERRIGRAAPLEWSRVRVRCARSELQSFVRYGLENGQIAWRAMSPCRYAGASGTSEIWLDRGVLDAGRGEVTAPVYKLAPPGEVIGLLRPDEAHEGDPPVQLTGGVLGDLIVAVQSESPVPVGVRPAPTPAQISNSHLGYAITWYGLAAALAGVYVAVLLGDRRRGRAAQV